MGRHARRWRSDDEDHLNPLVLLVIALLAPIAASLLQMALFRSREFEADRSGAELLGTGEAVAPPLDELEAFANRVPINVPSARASHFIVNPLMGRHVQLANLVRTHPSIAERVVRLGAR